MSRFHTHEWDFLPPKAFQPRGKFGGSMTLEGGKGGSAPPPDPRLVEAQIRSMGFQDEAIQEIMANAREMMPLQREQMQFGLDASRTAYNQSQEDRGWMLGRRGKLSGLQDTLAQDAEAFNTEGRGEQLAAQAVADVGTQMGLASQATTRQQQRMGVNPSSGAAMAMQGQMNIGEASAKASAANKMREAARLEGYSLTDRANNALAGYPAMGMQATGAGASFGAAGLGLANQGLAGMNSGFGAGANAAGGMGQNATGMFNAQAQYKLGSDKQAADNDPFASLLGAGAQLGVASIAKYSDRRLKTNIEVVGFDERTGLHLYEFEYINGTGQRYRGVMADEVERLHPEAVFETPDGFKAVKYHLIGLEMVAVEGETQ